MAINMLSSIGSRTKNYDLQKAIYKYLLVYYQQNGDFVEGLTVAKRLYVSSKENFDYEESSYAAESILYNLAGLNQVEKIGEVMKYTGLSRQTLHNYTMMGLIHEAERTDSGHRLYGEGVFDRIEKIKMLQRHRTLREVRDTLAKES